METKTEKMEVGHREGYGSGVGGSMERQADHKENMTIREMSGGMMFAITTDEGTYYLTNIADQGIIRLMGCGIVQAFDNVERKPLKEFCEKALEDRSLHLLAFERMGNKVDKTSLLEDLQNNRSDLGKILYNRVIRFVENSKCRPKQLIQKIKLLVGTQQYEVLKRLHFEIESEDFKKSLNIFYQFSENYLN